MGVMNSVMTFFGFGGSEAPASESVAKPRLVTRRRSSVMSEFVFIDP